MVPVRKHENAASVDANLDVSAWQPQASCRYVPVCSRWHPSPSVPHPSKACNKRLRRPRPGWPASPLPLPFTFSSNASSSFCASVVSYLVDASLTEAACLLPFTSTDAGRLSNTLNTHIRLTQPKRNSCVERQPYQAISTIPEIVQHGRHSPPTAVFAGSKTT